jgi:hypothetical protein
MKKYYPGMIFGFEMGKNRQLPFSSSFSKVMLYSELGTLYDKHLSEINAERHECKDKNQTHNPSC